MRTNSIVELTDCSELRQALQVKPPAVVHGAALLLTAALVAALVWMGLTKVNLVVRAPGRARPVSVPARVFLPTSVNGGARVAEVHYKEGDHVKAGAVLLKLETERLDNEIAKRKRTIAGGQEELTRMTRLDRTHRARYEACRAKAEAELTHATEEVTRATKRRTVDIQLASIEVEKAADNATRIRRLRGVATSASEVLQAVSQERSARENLAKAELPVDAGKVAVLRRALSLAEQEEEVRREENDLKRAHKQAEVESATLELANFELERRQSTLLAPCDGVIISRELKVGDVPERSRPIIEVAAEGGYVFEVAVPNAEIGHLKVGLPARVRIDAYDYQKYGTLAGEVIFLSADSGVPDQGNQNGQHGQGSASSKGKGQAVYLVKVAVEGTELVRNEMHGEVKLGMTGQAEIVTGRESLLWLLLRKIRRSISFS